MARKQKDEVSQPVVWAIAIAAVIILFNQIQLFQLNNMLGIQTISVFKTGGTLTLSAGEGKILTPILLAQGESPVLQGYRTKIKELPTISSNTAKDKTGDAVQDAINALVPTGIPEYGQEAGVSFDDPINSLKIWGMQERAIKLDSEQQKRYTKIIGSYTCDYCCGSPQNPTIITNCGCAHAAAWKGIAKFMVQKYGEKASDEQIMGEMSRWKTLWYPGPTIKRVLQEQSLSAGEAAAPVNLNELPSMVGGC